MRAVQASSFSPIEPAPPAHGWRSAGNGALEAAAFTVPLSLGSVTLVFSRVGSGALAAAVLATLLCLAVLHIATLRSRRPVLYSARFFEATTLAAMLDQLIVRMPAWSLADTPGVRIALLACIVAGAGLFAGLLFAIRADRFTRFIPSPVFAGFSNSIAVVIVLTQTQTLAVMVAGQPAVVVLSVAAVAMVTGFVARWTLPRWPAAATALALGALTGIAWRAMGQPVPMLDTPSFDLNLPIAMADFRALAGAGVPRFDLALVLAGHAAVLGTMIFINTSLTAEVLSQADERPRERVGGHAWVAVWMAVAGLVGSAPISGSVQSSSAATRRAAISAWTLAFTGAMLMVIGLSGVPAWIPLAAVAGTLLAEAWFMVDRPSLRNLVRWLNREKLGGHMREDLALIATVTAVAVLVNMVAAIFAGLLLGLLLFAVRNARTPVRHAWTGEQLSSNCARSRADVKLLSRHAAALRVLEFERDLFFGAVDGLERVLNEEIQRAACIVLDWTAVRHLDTSAAQAIVKAMRAAQATGIAVFHVEPAPDTEAASALRQFFPQRQGASDLDHTLELAENHLLALHASQREGEATTMIESTSLLHGLNESQRQRVNAAMPQRIVPRGEPLVQAGESSSELLLVLQGSASVVLPQPGGQPIRIAGVRRGATVGEMGFLDGTPRSATVLAEEETLVAVLTREAFDRMGREAPDVARQLVANIAIDVATRLRRANSAASARLRRR